MATENKNTDGAGEGLRLIKWSNDKYPPIDLSNELPSVMALIKAYKELRRDWDQLKEDNKILKDLLKRIEARSATLDNGVNPDSAADKQIASIWEMAHEANTILSPSNTEKNDKE